MKAKDLWDGAMMKKRQVGKMYFFESPKRMRKITECQIKPNQNTFKVESWNSLKNWCAPQHKQFLIWEL